MIKCMQGLPAGVIGFEASGKVSGHDYESVLMPAVEAATAEGGKLHLLYLLGPGFDGYEFGAIWDDTKVGLRHLGAWQKIALVSDVEWMRNAVKVFGFALPGEMRVFSVAELEQAKTWLAP